MIWIFDSSPLIYLNKVGLNWIFELLEGEKVIPVTVYNQVVVQGKMRGEADAVISETLVKKGIINVEKVENGFKKTLESFGSELHEGELEVLALAKNRNGTAILDESIARDIGRILNIEIHGTLFLIFLMVKRNLLKKEEAKDKVNVMVRKGFRLGHDKYVEFMELLEGI
jgi:predicted nucleic acid-binding protein